MNRKEFSEFRDQHYAQIAAINDVKGHDYAGDDDALANFKAAARDLGMTPYQVWAVYHHKHQSAIDSFIREGKVESEPIEGRIHDAILYLFLLLGLIEDEKRLRLHKPPPMPNLGPEPTMWKCLGGAERHPPTVQPIGDPCFHCGRSPS